MEAVGAVASVIAVVELVAKVSASAASFMRDVKDARRDMIQVRKDMSDLSMILRMVAEDLDQDSSPTDDESQSQKHIVDIAHSCRTVLLEMDTALQKGRTRLGWVTSGRERVERLRERLETCKLSLDVALDYRTMVVVHDIKEDSTRIVGDLSAIQRDMTLLLAKVDNIEQKTLEDLASGDGAAYSGDGFILDRFLNECRSDAQTVLDNIDYQQDQVFEEVPPQVPAEVPEMASELKPESTTSASPSTILLKNSLGHTYEIPLKQCRTWEHIDEIIKHSYPRDSDDRKEIESGRYTLYHNGQEISPNSWGDFVGPGLSFDLALWKCQVIKFEDALGRKFNFPFHLIKTWVGIEDLIKQAFFAVEGIEPHVVEGHYDLMGPDDTIILPVNWEQSVRPNMSIRMCMWPPVDCLAQRVQAGDTGRPGSSPLEHEQQQPPPPHTLGPFRVDSGPSQTNGFRASWRKGLMRFRKP